MTTFPIRPMVTIASFNNGVFDESSGRVEYTSPETSFSSAHQQWVLNSGSHTGSWSVQADVHVGLAGLQLFKSSALKTQADLFFIDNSNLGRFVTGASVPDIGTLNGRVNAQQAVSEG